MDYKAKFQMGETLRDSVTGFEGVVISITFYHTGGVHYGLHGISLEGSISAEAGVSMVVRWISESRLEPVSKER